MDPAGDRLFLTLARMLESARVEAGVGVFVDVTQADGPIGIRDDGAPGKRPVVPIRLALEAEFVGKGSRA
ncbi:MAG TPA: hypothetical protein EYQ31_07840 [Candidatus Handelsmanbacteria bacterium]|nr:hypothetical protein [Candidatus Handelsmanbacteria bacterium]